MASAIRYDTDLKAEFCEQVRARGGTPDGERRMRLRVRRLKEPRAADTQGITQLKAGVEVLLVSALHQATVENSHLHRQLANRRAHASVHVLPTQTTP
ncbi:hypothetical protein ACWC4C_14295 [Streptomyces olivaceoviridis]